jgi:hypothetical protein
MVNAKFPERERYGFEMVDAPDGTLTIAKPASIENLRRIESFGFLQIFRDLGSMQTLAVYRRLLRKGSIARSIAA